MKITTNYWKTDKLIPSEIRDKIRDASQRAIGDLLYAHYGPRLSTASVDDDGILIRIPRDYILQHNDYDLDDANLKKRKGFWSELQTTTNTRNIIKAVLARQVEHEATLITNCIMNDYMDYMGIGELANNIVRESRIENRERQISFMHPSRSNRTKYDDDIWEKIHDDEK